VTTPYESLIKLGRSLLEATKKGVVEWRETALPETFAFSGTEGSVLLSKEPIGASFSLAVLDSAGRKVDGYDRFRSRLGHQPRELDAQELELRDTLGDLYALVARGSPESRRVIDSLIEDVRQAVG
jgi:hypothetical protein